MVKSINIFIKAVMGCGKGCWGFCLCSRGVCSDAPRLAESLGVCLHQDGEETGNKEVYSGGEKMNI